MAVKINGEALPEGEYQLTAKKLVLGGLPGGEFTLEIETSIKPQVRTTLVLRIFSVSESDIVKALTCSKKCDSCMRQSGLFNKIFDICDLFPSFPEERINGRTHTFYSRMQSCRVKYF